MAASLFAMFLLAVVTFPMFEGSSVIDSSARMDVCSACMTVMDKVPTLMSNGTTKVCSSYVSMQTLQKVCTYIQQQIVELVFGILEDEQGALQLTPLCFAKWETDMLAKMFQTQESSPEGSREGVSRSAETDGGPTRPKKGSGESDGPRKVKKGSGESDGPTIAKKGSGESDGPTKTKKGSGELEGPRTLLGFGAVDFDTKTMKRKSAESGSGETSGEPRSTIAPSDIQSMLFNQIQNPSREYEDRSQEISCLPTLTMMVYVACVVAIVYVLVNYSQKTRQ
ncbi:unnamed protein product [Nippostrongylus brasiliensis]|uniref:AAI domain-containing protein n=1 Tax=Nippostrongylus brasiliensis TaxID=27835 RepID=A0A0N4Y611_NIPBR|nr:unnamed protein product [Nippostrongylus brasiliensis]